jgi:hypothetical protein
LQSLGDHLAGQQLANLAKAASPLDPGYYLVQIPVAGQPGDPYRTAELRIYHTGDEDGSPAGSRVNPENARIVFHLSLSQLQTVDVDLNIVQRRVSCRITSGDEATARFIQDRAGGLCDGLFALGYVVDDVRSVSRPPTAPDAGTRGRGDAAKGIASRILRLDARA